MSHMRTTINLPSSLFKEAKLFAVNNELNFTELIILSIQKMLSESKTLEKSLTQLIDELPPLEDLSESEQKKRYQAHFDKKYGKNFS
jgi:hypothetical protein